MIDAGIVSKDDYLRELKKLKNLKKLIILFGIAAASFLLNVGFVDATAEDKTAELLNNEEPVDQASLDSANVIQLSFPVNQIELYQEEQDQYLPKVVPENAIDKVYHWESSQPIVASVDATTGKITALNEGETVITATHLNTGLSASYKVVISGGWGNPVKIGTDNFYTRKYSNELSLRYGFGRYDGGTIAGYANINIIENGITDVHLYGDGNQNRVMLGGVFPVGTTMSDSISDLKKEQGRIYKREKADGTIEFLYREDYIYDKSKGLNKFKISKFLTSIAPGIKVKTTVTNVSNQPISNMTFWEYQNVTGYNSLYAIGGNKGLYFSLNGKKIEYQFYQTQPMEWFGTFYNNSSTMQNNIVGEEHKNTPKGSELSSGDSAIRWKRMPSQYAERIPTEIFDYSIEYKKVPELTINRDATQKTSPGNYLITGKIKEPLYPEAHLYYRIAGGEWILGTTVAISDFDKGQPTDFSLEIPLEKLPTEKKVDVDIKAVNEGGLESKIFSIIPLMKSSFSKEQIELFPGEKDQYLPDIFPTTATDKKNLWTSSNPEVASVDENSGNVTALNDGVTEIKMTHLASGITNSYRVVIAGGWQEVSTIGENSTYYTRRYTNQLSLRYGFGRLVKDETGGIANLNIVENDSITQPFFNGGSNNQSMHGSAAVPGSSLLNILTKKDQQHMYKRQKADETLEFLYREDYSYSNGSRFKISKVISPVRLGINVKTTVTNLTKTAVKNMSFWEYQNINWNTSSVAAIGENKGMYILLGGKRIDFIFHQTSPMEWQVLRYGSVEELKNNFVGEESKNTIKNQELISGDANLLWKRMPNQYDERTPVEIFDYSMHYNKAPELTVDKKFPTTKSASNYKVSGKVTEYLSQQVAIYYRIANGAWTLSKTLAISDAERGYPKLVTLEIPFNQISSQENPKLEFKAVNNEGLESTIDSTIPLQKIKFPVETLELYQGERDQYLPTISPTNTADKNFYWESSNPAVASVNSETGEVVAFDEGTTKITVSHLNSDLTATYNIVVAGGWGYPVKIQTENAHTRKLTNQLSLRYGFGRFGDTTLGGFANLNIIDKGTIVKHLFGDGNNQRTMLGGVGLPGHTLNDTGIIRKEQGRVYRREKPDGTIEFLYRERVTYAGGYTFQISKWMSPTPIGINVKTTASNTSNQAVANMTFWEYQDTMLERDDVSICAIGDNRGLFIEANGYRIDYQFNQSSGLISPIQWDGSDYRDSTITNNAAWAEAGNYKKGAIVKENVDTAIKWKQMPSTYSVRTTELVFDMNYSLMKKPVITLEKSTDISPGKEREYLLKGTAMEPLTNNATLYYRIDNGEWLEGQSLTFTASEKEKAKAFSQIIPANLIPVGKNCTIEVKMENEAGIKSDDAKMTLTIPIYSAPILKIKEKEQVKQVNLKDGLLELEGSLVTTVEANYKMYVEINNQKQLFYEEKELKMGAFNWGAYRNKLEGLEVGKSYSAKVSIVDGYGKQSNLENITIYAVGELGFNTIPQIIDFGQVKIPFKSTLYEPKETSGFEIGDYRGKNKRFKLTLKLSKELTDAKTNEVIKNTLLFFKENQFAEPIPLVKNTTVKVVAGDTGPNNQNQVTKVKFNRETGLSLKLTNGVLLGDYTGEITWTLEDAP